MNSKECLYEILGMLNYEQMDVCEKHNYLKVISQDLDRLEQLEKSVEHYEATIKRWGEKYHLLEKQYKQTKSNFKNSQTHSKNCYKKLKEKYIKTLQELVDKETPMKVDKKDNKKIKCDKFLITLVTYYKCPNKRCEFHNNYNILEGEKRCDECGQKLDWSDTDE